MGQSKTFIVEISPPKNMHFSEGSSDQNVQCTMLSNFAPSPHYYQILFTVYQNWQRENYTFLSDTMFPHWLGILQSNVLPGISELCEDIVVVFLPLLCQAGRIRHTAGCCHGWEGPGQTYWRVSRLGTACVVASPCALEPHTLLESPSLPPPAGALRFSPSRPHICRLNAKIEHFIVQIECFGWKVEHCCGKL